VAINKSGFDKKMKQVLMTPEKVIKDAYKFFVDTTPIDTGYAKQHTKLKLKEKTIVAMYKYASILDKGRHRTSKGMRGSNQAPNGMTEPTIKKFNQWIKAYVKTIK
jgi:hypothetical protein